MRPVHFSWVDAAKGFGIILVVVGHTVRGLVSSDIMTWTPTSRFVDAWIYAFHMPLFFLLSGLFLFRSMEKLWGEFAWEKIKTIAYPYFVWSLITLALKDVLGEWANHPYDLGDLPQIFYQPIDQFWFLYVLFVLSFIVSALLKIEVRPWAILVLAIVLYPGLYLDFSYGLGILHLTAVMAIYVAIGVVIGSSRNLQALSGIQVHWLVVAAVVGAIASSLAGWVEPSYRVLFQPVLAVSGVTAVIALSLLIDKTKVGAAIQFLGRYSLEIYVAHTIASAGVRIALLKFGNISDPALHLVLGTVAGLGLPIALALLLEKVGFPFGFTLGRRNQRDRKVNPTYSPLERV